MKKELSMPSFAFDLEGTLVDLERFHQLAFAEVASKLEVVFGQEEFYQFVGAGDEAISKAITDLCRKVGRKIDHLEVRILKNAVYRDILYSNEISTREGVPVYLDRAKFLGGDLVIASLTPKIDTENIITRTGLSLFFRYILTEDDVTKLKPDPEVYLKAARLIQIGNNRMLVHEDSPAGVKAAKAAESPVAAFPVYENLQFEPQPNAIYLSWIGLDPGEIYNSLVNKRKTF